MSLFDTSLIKSPYGTGNNSPATLNGIDFRIDPDTVSLPISAKTSRTPTLGGMVVQVYGVTWGDLTVTGSFGIDGWQGQLAFLDRMVAIARAQGTQSAAIYTGQNFSPGQPVRFTFPLLNWDFKVFLKAYTSPDGPAVVQSNQIVNPRYTLTMVIDDDNGSLDEVTSNAYIQRLAEGLGVMWNPTQATYTGYSQSTFNAPTDPTSVQNYINSQKSEFEQEYGYVPTTAQLNAAQFGGPGTIPSTTSAGTTGAVTTVSNANVKNMNDFSNAVLKALGITATQTNVKLLNAQQQAEDQWSASGEYNAANMHNPLNIGKAPGVPSSDVTQLTGTISIATWAEGITATANVIQQPNYSGMLNGLTNSDPTEFFAGIAGWATNPSYSSDVQTIYNGL